MKFTTSSFIVLDKNTTIDSCIVGSYMHHHEPGEPYLCEYTNEGAIIYDVDAVTPVIIRGRGCIGTSKVTSFKIAITNGVLMTKVKYFFTKLDSRVERNKHLADAYYSMYRNSVNTSFDPNEAGDDVFIPGIVGGTLPTSGQRDPYPGSKSKSSRSIDDDDDEYDHDPLMNKIMHTIRGDYD